MRSYSCPQFLPVSPLQEFGFTIRTVLNSLTFLVIVLALRWSLLLDLLRIETAFADNLIFTFERYASSESSYAQGLMYPQQIMVRLCYKTLLPPTRHQFKHVELSEDALDYSKGVKLMFEFFEVDLARPPGFTDYAFYVIAKPSGIVIQIQLKEAEVYDIIHAMESVLYNKAPLNMKYLGFLEFGYSKDDPEILVLSFGFQPSVSQVVLPFNGKDDAHNFLTKLRKFVTAEAKIGS